jgi:general secretion pathway protein H
VVVLIIGLFAGVAVLSLGVLGSDRELQREAERLSTLMGLVQEEALMQGRDFGVLFSASSYRFLIFDYQSGTWVTPAADNILRERALPEQLTISLRLDDRDVALDPDLQDIPDTAEPQVLLLSSGEMTPFEAGFGRELETGEFRLSGEFNGKVNISGVGFPDS